MKKLIFSLMLALGVVLSVNAQTVNVTVTNNMAQGCNVRVMELANLNNGVTLTLNAAPPADVDNDNFNTTSLPLFVYLDFGGCTMSFNVNANTSGSVPNPCGPWAFSNIAYQYRFDPITNIATLFITISV